MADSITLDALMQSKGHTALQVQKPASVEAVRAQVEELSPEQKARVEEVKNSIDLMDSQAALQYGVGAQRNISSFSDNILTQVRSKDSGYVGELMSDLVLKVKEVDVDGLDEGFWDKIPFLKSLCSGMKSWRCRSTASSSSWTRPGCRCSRTSPCSTGCMKKTWNTSGSCKFTSPQAKKSYRNCRKPPCRSCAPKRRLRATP